MNKFKKSVEVYVHEAMNETELDILRTALIDLRNNGYTCTLNVRQDNGFIMTKTLYVKE